MKVIDGNFQNPDDKSVKDSVDAFLEQVPKFCAVLLVGLNKDGGGVFLKTSGGPHDNAVLASYATSYVHRKYSEISRDLPE